MTATESTTLIAPAATDPFADPARNALHTLHAPFARANLLACKYPADVAPFAALQENSVAAFEQLRSLLQPGEVTWLFETPPPAVEGLVHTHPEDFLVCLQMTFPTTTKIPEAAAGATILPLTCEHADEMVALTDLAFPGFFRQRTCVMGGYYGIRDEAGLLVAMGGERMMMQVDGQHWREISGVCTHPNHRDQGHAARLIVQLLHDHRRRGAVSGLHVAATNERTIGFYRHLGFEALREINCYRVRRAV